MGPKPAPPKTLGEVPGFVVVGVVPYPGVIPGTVVLGVVVPGVLVPGVDVPGVLVPGVDVPGLPVDVPPVLPGGVVLGAPEPVPGLLPENYKPEFHLAFNFVNPISLCIPGHNRKFHAQIHNNR